VIKRFSLYGFLKNQQYYEPFLILFFRDLGLSFTLIGFLIGYREVLINLFEVPSGVVADLWGRRRSMVVGWVAYIVSFIIFALAPAGPVGVALLFTAMSFFAVGESFRTGTHKAMIFTWLRNEGRTAEKTRIYGFTRSWAKAGSALSVIIAGAMVFFTGSYRYVWWMCLLPYAINMVNLATYPRELDGDISHEDLSIDRIVRELWISLKMIVRDANLRALLAESLSFDGLFNTTKDYIQPVVKHAALALPIFLAVGGEQRVALLVSAAYLVIYIIAFFSSRYAHRVEAWAGGDLPGSQRVWVANVLVYAALLALLLAGWYTVAIVAYLLVHLLHNIWRPMLLSRYDEFTPPERQATVLSVDSQAKSAFTMIFAPLVGLSVDHLGLWPLGLVGLVVSIIGLFWNRRTVAAAATRGQE
jgi:predicted MFS family arabinose efflux permease